jgi:hypothetical protein
MHNGGEHTGSIFKLLKSDLECLGINPRVLMECLSLSALGLRRERFFYREYARRQERYGSVLPKFSIWEHDPRVGA